VHTHDSITSCFTVWDKRDPVNKDEPWFAERHPEWTPHIRPAFGIQIYDETVPASLSGDKAAEYVWRRAESLWHAHIFRHREHHFRLDVYGLSANPDARRTRSLPRAAWPTRGGRWQRDCRRGGPTYVPRYWDEWDYLTGFRRGFIVIAKPDEKWNEDDRGLLQVWWDRARAGGAADELQAQRITLRRLQSTVADDFLSCIDSFYTCYVWDVELDAELKKWAVKIDTGTEDGETTKVDA
jgi:hypothetical protein